MMTSLATSYHVLACRGTYKPGRQRGTNPFQFLVGQTHAVLHAHLVADAAVLAKDGDALHLDAVLDNARRVAPDGGGRALDAGPGAHAAAPADNRVQHAGVVLDLRVLEHDALLDTGARADVHARADADVGAELGRGVHLGRGVDEDGGHDVDAGVRELVAAGLGRLLQVECVGGDGRASRLDLTPKVLSLVDVKLLVVGHVAQDVLFETDDFVLLALVIIVVVGEDEAVFEVVGGGVGNEAGGSIEATLNGGANRGKNGLGGEEVDTAVDEVADARLGLLDVVQDSAGVGVGNDAAKVGRGLVTDASTKNHSLGVLLDEQAEHLV